MTVAEHDTSVRGCTRPRLTLGRTPSSSILRRKSAASTSFVAVQLAVPVQRRPRTIVLPRTAIGELVVVGDAARREQIGELLLVHEIATNLILQVLLPVEPDGACDVTAVVGGGVFVDLDEDDAGGIEFSSAQSRRQDIGASHVVPFENDLRGQFVAGTGSGGNGLPAIDLATQADPERRVQERGEQSEAGEHRADHGGAGQDPSRLTALKIRPSNWRTAAERRVRSRCRSIRGATNAAKIRP